MHHTQSEKMEIIRLVEQSDTGVIRTLKGLKVHKTTFYKWYNTYLENGMTAWLESKTSAAAAGIK